MNGSRRLKRWRSRFDVIEDFLDYVWVNNVGDNAHGATAQWTHRNINVKDSFQSMTPSQGSNQFIYRVGIRDRSALTSIDLCLIFFTFVRIDFLGLLEILHASVRAMFCFSYSR
jgi:hypothetical protein